MSHISEYDAWLVKIEDAQLLWERNDRIQMIRLQLNTFSVSGDSFRPLSFYIPRGDEESVVEAMCSRFGVDDLGALKGKWATALCPLEKGNILGLHPAGSRSDPVMVMGRAAARRASARKLD